MSTDVDYKYKIVMIGDSGVGKTCLIRTFTSNSYEPLPKTTVAADFHTKLLSIGNLIIKLNIWDTAGQERFHSIPGNYYRGATGIVIIFDVTKRESFNNVIKWANISKNTCVPGAFIMLVAAKIDEVEKRVVNTTESSMLARENNFSYIEVSAKNNQNVQECFYNLAVSMSHQFNTNEYSAKKISSTNNNSDKVNTNSGLTVDGEFKIDGTKTEAKVSVKSESSCC